MNSPLLAAAAEPLEAQSSGTSSTTSSLSSLQDFLQEIQGYHQLECQKNLLYQHQHQKLGKRGQKQSCRRRSCALCTRLLCSFTSVVFAIGLLIGQMTSLAMNFGTTVFDYRVEASLTLAVSMHGNPYSDARSHRHGGNDVVMYPIGRYCKHALNGSLHGQSLFGHENMKHVNNHELRDLTIVENDMGFGSGLKYTEYTMYAANSAKTDSMILKYDDACTLQQPNLHVWARADVMIHPYGVAIADRSMFVTCQDSGRIFQFPIDDAFSPKVIAQMQQPRAVTASSKLHRVFVAERFGSSKYSPPNVGRIHIFDSLTGDGIGSFSFTAPIGMAMVSDKYLMIGCNQTHTVYAFDPITLEQKRSYTHADLRHPAGIAVYGTRMFVLSQQTNRIFEFDVVSGHGRVVVEDLPGPGEGIAVMPCIPRKLKMSEQQQQEDMALWIDDDGRHKHWYHKLFSGMLFQDLGLLKQENEQMAISGLKTS